VVGNKVFVTCYSGYGLDPEKPGDMEDLRRHLLCIELATGRIAWQKDVPAAQPEADYVDFMPNHGYATSTPASDGERVYVFFGKSGVYAFDLQGQQLWHADAGSQLHSWGVGASPILHGDRLIINAAIESSSILALDKHTGKLVWKAKNLFSSWSTPIVAEAPGGKQELVVSVLRKLAGLDPATGEMLWSHYTTQSHCAPSPVVADGLVYAVDSNPSRLLAVRTGSRGKLDEEQLAWTATGVGSGVSSPLYHDGYVYTVERGVVSCVDAKDGQIAYRRRLGEGGTFYASPVAVEGKLYLVSRDRGTYVLSLGPNFQLLSLNRLDDDSIFNATPALVPGGLLLRSDQFLYCIRGTAS
jgi:outer membrane protein assembly factor BamB